ncbi:relaxase/mobilization nuclease domain-containing protein [Mangrovibacterium marinum]|uniref:Relaxase/mobilization nuclease-like protein n=1 Tax=Mangrovibacterium marinum TaxID=1639118 RepID=A0A2T5C5C1_9BACT|nr:relaxase/mobilization nuclease domain-containing protein [Mangrovibacterium marinum]PTN10105.1 relaxase/mobilization nuclease-like protein [Mangrovibacterium marinum]
MVIKIHQACTTKNALFYNERKVERQKASFYHSQNMPVMNPFLGDKNDRYRIFEEIEERNTRVKKPGLHISVNPTVSDLVRLGDTGIRNEISKLMEHLGYGNQPYLVYKHADIDRIHFHIVSTRIDCDTGKKIKDNYEREKTQRFIKSLEQKYGLTKEENPQKLNYRFSGSSRNLKQNLESLFGQLNQMDFIRSKAMYDEALKMFDIEIRPFGRGYAAFVTDGTGNPVRYPIRLSEFEERPNFYAERNLGHEVKFVMNQKIGFPENFKRELLKALVYQYGKDDEAATGKLNRHKQMKRNKRGRRM